MKKMTFQECADSIFRFYAENGMDFGDERPKVVVDDEPVSRFDVFAPTGHYDWTEDEITLRTAERHAKDVLRTFCHELVHAWQFRRDGQKYREFDKGGNLEENPELLKYEVEAYQKGNVLFRMWTEKEHGR